MTDLRNLEYHYDIFISLNNYYQCCNCTEGKGCYYHAFCNKMEHLVGKKFYKDKFARARKNDKDYQSIL